MSAFAAPARASTWAAIAAGAVAVGAGTALLPLPARALPLAGAAYAAVAALALRGLAGAAFTAADRVTLARAALVCLLAGAIGAPPDPALAAPALLAVALDAVDGWVARRTGATAFGARFDMETDAALGLVLCLLLAPVVGAWALAAGLARYAFLAAGAAWPALAAELPPSARRRAACAIQLLALVAALALASRPAAAAACVALALAATLGSFAIDVAWLLRRR